MLARGRLEVQLIPATAWGKNVRSSVPRSRWLRLGRTRSALVRHRCEVCSGPPNRPRLDLHEQWRYHEYSGIQQLVGLISLCEPCHAVVHSARTSSVSNNNEDVVRRACNLTDRDIVKRLCAVNTWTDAQADAHRERAGNLFDRRSAIEWTLDISYLARAEAELLAGRIPQPIPGDPDGAYLGPPPPAAAKTDSIEVTVTPDEIRELHRRAKICSDGSIEDYVRMRLLDGHSLHADQVLLGHLLPVVQLGKRCACGIGQLVSDAIRAGFQQHSTR